MRRLIVIFAIQFIVSAPLFAQNLTRLHDRAQQLLDLRCAGDKTRASQFIEASRRSDFLDSQPPPMRDAHVTGFEFPNDPKSVYVLFTAVTLVPDVGPFPRTGRERWIWKGNEWFLDFERAPNLFEASKHSAPAQVRDASFEFTSSTVDFGNHVQGEILKTVLQFKGNRDEIDVIKAPPGLSMGVPAWKSQTSGEVEITVDTALLSGRIRQKVEFTATTENHLISAPVELDAEIEPRLKITQIPEIIDPTKPGTVELRIENISTLTFEAARVVSTRDAYHVTSHTTGTIPPGQTLSVVVNFQAEEEPSGALIYIRTSVPILARQEFPIPIRVKRRFVPDYTQETINKLIQQAK